MQCSAPRWESNRPKHRDCLTSYRLARATRVRAQLDPLDSRLEHGTSAGEEHPLLHDHTDRRDIALYPGSTLHLDHPERADIAVNAPDDQRFSNFDVGPHDAVLADLEAFAVEDVAFELAVDSQRSRHHQGSAKTRPYTQDGVGCWR